MIKKILCFYLLTFTSMLSAQTIKGKVSDALGEAIPYAKIRIANTSYGTVANAIGLYQMEISANHVVLMISALGYETKVDSLFLNETLTSYDVVLKEQVQEVGEVVIISKSKKERGKEIMKQVIDKRAFFYQQTTQFSCDTYCFGSLEKEIQDSIMKDSIIGKESMNLIEWKAKSYYKADKLFRDEFIAFNDFNDENAVSLGTSVSVNFDGT